jgi:hypothetical protein
MTPCTLILPLLLNTPAQDLARPQDVDLARTAIASQELRLELYDLGDLTGLDDVNVLSADLFDLIKGESGTGPEYKAKQEELSAARARAEDLAQALADVLKLHMLPKFVAGHNTLTLLDNGHLVLSASPEQHGWVADFLAFQRQPQGFLQIEARMITVPQGTMAGLGVEGSAQIFEEFAEFEALLQRVSALQAGVEVVTAPKILTRPLQEATASILNQVSYVSDYKLEVVEPGNVEIADPVIDVIQEGVVFRVRGVPLSPGIYGVEVDLTQSTLQRPIPTFETVIGAGRHEVSISLPQVTKRGVRTHLTLADGAAAVFVSPDDADDRDLVVTFRLTNVPEGEWDLLDPKSSSDEGGK